VTANETGRADELDYCNVQFPLSLSVGAGQTTPLIYGRVYEAGVTDPAGADPSIIAEVGFGPENVNPSSQSGFVFGPGKRTHAERYSQEAGVPLSACAFYTDSYSDLPVLEVVGRPVAVHPDHRLRREAARRGWPVVDWGVPTAGAPATGSPASS
jgi:hypothetical protein